MALGRGSDRLAPASRHGRPLGRLVPWAVRLSVVCGAAFAVSAAAVAIAYAVGAESAVQDTRLAWCLGLLALTGFAASLAAFLAAIVAKVEHASWTEVWLPLCLFPALLAFLVLGEALWWE